MKILIILLLIVPNLALAYPVECRKAQQECRDALHSLPVNQQVSFFCYVDKNPIGCTDEKILQYTKNEMIKAGYDESINLVTELSDLPNDPDFDYATSGAISFSEGLGSGGFSSVFALIIGAIGAVLIAVVTWFKKKK